MKYHNIDHVTYLAGNVDSSPFERSSSDTLAFFAASAKELFTSSNSSALLYIGWELLRWLLWLQQAKWSLSEGHHITLERQCQCFCTLRHVPERPLKVGAKDRD